MTDQEQAIANLLKQGKSQTSITKILQVKPDDVKRVKAALAAEQLGNTGDDQSGAGNLSPESKAKLLSEAGQQGSKGETSPPEPKPEMSPDEVAAQLKAMGFNSPLDFATGLVTLQQRVGDLESAVEDHAKALRGKSVARPRAAVPAPHVGPEDAPATPDEERAYSIANAGGGGFDGIGAWRKAGRPGLEA